MSRPKGAVKLQYFQGNYKIPSSHFSQSQCVVAKLAIHPLSTTRTTRLALTQSGERRQETSTLRAEKAIGRTCGMSEALDILVPQWSPSFELPDAPHAAERCMQHFRDVTDAWLRGARQTRNEKPARWRASWQMRGSGFTGCRRT